MEASGTSGHKAGLNGIPNFSVLDGWWDEGYDGTNGWSIGQVQEYPDEAAQDAADALSLYDTLENVIVPLFYDRGPDGIPHNWLEKVRASIRTVAPVYSLARMLKEYYTKYYFPASQFGHQVDGGTMARDLAEWERQVRQVAAGVVGGDGCPGSDQRSRRWPRTRLLWFARCCVRARSRRRCWRWSWSTARMAAVACGDADRADAYNGRSGRRGHL